MPVTPDHLAGYAAVSRTLDDWHRLRADIAAIERADHPDLTDHHGRVWTWVSGDLYRHCSLAWPMAFVLDTRHGLPTARARSNPNYVLCSTCNGLPGETRPLERMTP